MKSNLKSIYYTVKDVALANVGQCTILKIHVKQTVSVLPRRLEQNQITEVPARAFLPYPRLRRM